MSLEEVIRDLAGRGELTHISLVPRGKGWSATFTPAGTFDKGFAEGDDPVETMIEAMTNAKLRRRSVKVSKPKEPEPTLEDDGLPDPLA